MVFGQPSQKFLSLRLACRSPLWAESELNPIARPTSRVTWGQRQIQKPAFVPSSEVLHPHTLLPCKSCSPLLALTQQKQVIRAFRLPRTFMKSWKGFSRAPYRVWAWRPPKKAWWTLINPFIGISWQRGCLWFILCHYTHWKCSGLTLVAVTTHRCHHT